MFKQIWQAVEIGCRAAIKGIWRALSVRASEEAIDLDDPVGGAIRDAELLIAFAAQSFRRIKPEKVAKLMETAAVISSAREAGQAISHAQRSAFWTAYDELAVDMAPLSAHSIRSSMNINAKRIPASFFTPTAIIAAMALVVFLLCLAVQGFWVAGKELTERAEKLDSQKLGIQQKLTQNDISSRRAKARLDEVQVQICQIDPGQCAEISSILGKNEKRKESGRLVELGAEKKWIRSEVLVAELHDTELSTELGKLYDASRPLNSLLQEWHRRAYKVCGLKYMSWLCPLGQQTEVDQSIEEIKTKILALEKEMREPMKSLNGSMNKPADYDASSFRLTRETMVRDRNIQSLKLQLNKKEIDKFGSILLEVRIIVGNISTYVIAMLMGLLGALTFILRTMSQQLREHTYVPTSVSISIIRICLGAIAGVFGSLLVPGAEASLKSVPPLFIPFVFGYGIEILFSLLDKTVNSFTHPDGGAGNGNGRK